MDEAKIIFDTLIGFKQTGDGKSPEQKLIEYCQNDLGKIERLHYDFKTSGGFPGNSLVESDMNNLATAVSGFANSSGGVIIWGIEDKKIKPKPIDNIEEFTSCLLKNAHLVTDPTVQGIDGDWLPSINDPGKGFALVHVPESELPPHRVSLTNDKINGRYYFRSGESFVAACHSQLEDMFGRRPKPKLSLFTIVNCSGPSGPNFNIIDITVGIENHGRGLARYPFLQIKNIASSYKDRYPRKLDLDEWDNYTKEQGHRYSSSTKVIYPTMQVNVACIPIEFPPQASIRNAQSVEFDYMIAAEGILPIVGHEVVSGSRLLQSSESRGVVY